MLQLNLFDTVLMRFFNSIQFSIVPHLYSVSDD